MNTETTPNPDWANLVGWSELDDLRTCQPHRDPIDLDIDADAIIVALGDWSAVLLHLADAMAFVSNLTISPKQRLPMHWYVEQTMKMLVENDVESGMLLSLVGLYRWPGTDARMADRVHKASVLLRKAVHRNLGGSES